MQISPKELLSALALNSLETLIDPAGDNIIDGRYIVTFKDGKPLSAAFIPEGACVVDPNNKEHIMTMLRDFVPSKVLVKVFAEWTGNRK